VELEYRKLTDINARTFCEYQSQSQSIYYKHITNVYAQYSVDTSNIESIQKPEEAIYNIRLFMFNMSIGLGRKN